MKLIVGIGNPEKKYFNTRHNIGFTAVDFIAGKCGVESFEYEKKLDSETAKCPDFVFAKGGLQNRGSLISASRNRDKINGKPVILAKPQTFVNKSGEAVRKLVKNLKLKTENLVVIHDDLDIKFGQTKLSFEKDSAGHKGIESIIKALKTKKFYRLRIGLANDLLKKARRQKTLELKKKKVGDFVLSPFTPAEKKKIPQLLKDIHEKLIVFG